MHFQLACRISLVLLVIAGVLGQSWRVTHTPEKVCALKSSSVVLSCTYTYPKGHKITKTFWFNKQVEGEEPSDLTMDPEYRDRVEYLGDKDHDCTLKITDVRESDSGTYKFMFRTDAPGQGGMSERGVALSITDVEVEASSDQLTEGGWVVLHCGSCILSFNPTYIWSKNRRPLTSTLRDNHLHLESVSVEDTGSYSCAVQGHEGLQSRPVTLSVRYAPKNTSVSVSSSGDIVEGSSVTLTCKSDANPPVEKYTWFKVNVASPVGSGQNYHIINISAEESGQYYCEARNNIGGQNSTAVSLITEGEAGVPLLAVVGIVLAVLAAVALMFVVSCGVRRRNTQPLKTDHLEDTYAALDPMSRSPEYETLASVKSSQSNTYTTETAQASDYESIH